MLSKIARRLLRSPLELHRLQFSDLSVSRSSKLARSEFRLISPPLQARRALGGTGMPEIFTLTTFSVDRVVK